MNVTARKTTSAVEIPSTLPPAGERQPPLHFAGTHLILDLWGARALDDPKVVELALRESAEAAGATLLHSHVHRFMPEGGISGVAVLAESHISIHTWPERGYAALDVFMCGNCDPQKAVPVLRRAFAPRFLIAAEHRRGAGVPE